MILATYSFEEAEILCDIVSWLKRGNFACIGNPEQLKLQYYNGYKMWIKFINSVLNKKDYQLYLIKWLKIIMLKLII